MKIIRQNINGIILCLFELIVGILLLINPVQFTSGIIMGAGICLLVLGLISVIKYFKTDAMEAAASQTLMKGLMELLIGGFCVFNSYWFVATFPVLTMIYGVTILVAGMSKVQISVDMLRLKKPRWYFAFISALVSIICAILILNNSFQSTTFLWLFTGISLIIEAVFDVFTLSFNRASKAEPAEEEPIVETVPEEAEEESPAVEQDAPSTENDIIDADETPAEEDATTAESAESI